MGNEVIGIGTGDIESPPHAPLKALAQGMEAMMMGARRRPALVCVCCKDWSPPRRPGDRLLQVASNTHKCCLATEPSDDLYADGQPVRTMEERQRDGGLAGYVEDPQILVECGISVHQLSSCKIFICGGVSAM